jgi:hypothetical protein
LQRLAVRIVEAGSVSPEMLASVRRILTELPGLDHYDMEIICEVEDAAATKDLLQRAIALQSKKVSEQKKLAITEICNAFRSERETIARDLAAAFWQFGAALRDELSFIKRLRSQDPEILNFMCPPPFPMVSIPSDEVLDWAEQILELPEQEAKDFRKVVENHRIN